jgi:hypothetical protein
MLPPMAVVAFSGVSAPQRAKFKASLNSLCAGNAKSSCDSVGIAALKAADETSYAKVIAKYPDP